MSDIREDHNENQKNVTIRKAAEKEWTRIFHSYGRDSAVQIVHLLRELLDKTREPEFDAGLFSPVEPEEQTSDESSQSGESVCPHWWLRLHSGKLREEI